MTKPRSQTICRRRTRGRTLIARTGEKAFEHRRRIMSDRSLHFGCNTRWRDSESQPLSTMVRSRFIHDLGNRNQRRLMPRNTNQNLSNSSFKNLLGTDIGSCGCLSQSSRSRHGSERRRPSYLLKQSIFEVMGLPTIIPAKSPTIQRA